MGCECEEGWSGDLCDIQGDEEPECDLDYQNEGSCDFGVKGYKDSCDFGVKGYKDSHDLLDLPVLAKKHENGMYCSCPSGFTGLKCEVDISHCHLHDGPNNHFCLNGVPCNPDEFFFYLHQHGMGLDGPGRIAWLGLAVVALCLAMPLVLSHLIAHLDGGSRGLPR